VLPIFHSFTLYLLSAPFKLPAVRAFSDIIGCFRLNLPRLPARFRKRASTRAFSTLKRGFFIRARAATAATVAKPHVFVRLQNEEPHFCTVSYVYTANFAPFIHLHLLQNSLKPKPIFFIERPSISHQPVASLVVTNARLSATKCCTCFEVVMKTMIRLGSCMHRRHYNHHWRRYSSEVRF